MEMQSSERKEILKGKAGILNDADNKADVKQLMLFLSFDITDSTLLKLRYPNEWANVIDVLLTTKFQYMEAWKFNGDEMLYKRTINSLEFICKIAEAAYDFLDSLQKEMQQYIPEASVKATLWIAVTEEKHNGYKQNFGFKFNEINDFVGKSIDEGFRLTKCSSMQKVALDPKIVFILLDAYQFLSSESTGYGDTRFCKSVKDCDKDALIEQISEILGRTHLIGYAKCKGVWDGAPYPVYWYYSDSSNKGIRYSEYLDGRHIWDQKPSPLSEGGGYSVALNNIRDIFRQQKVDSEIKEIYQLLDLKGEIAISSEGKANLYFMVACVNPKTKKVLIAKRGIATRKHLKNVWDFGNVKYQNVDMKGTIEKEYKNTFGIEIELITDHGREENLKPFGYCTIYRNCRAHNSILCYAVIKSPCDMDDAALVKYIMENRVDKDKYSEVRFVGASEVESFKELSLDDIRIDSEKAEQKCNEPYPNDSCIRFFSNSIAGAVKEICREQKESGEEDAK